LTIAGLTCACGNGQPAGGGSNLPQLRPLWLDLGLIARRLAGSPSLWIATDYDGTLTPIVRRADGARLEERGRAVLARLASAPGVRLAVLSGRRLHDLDAQLGVPGAFLAGTAGLETRQPGGLVESHVSSDAPLSDELRQELEAWCRRHAGAWLEDKGPALAIHYREMGPHLRAAFSAGVRRRLAPVRSRLKVVAGKRVFEILPDVGWGKLEAIELWRREASREDPLFFFGDDAIDEPVHRGVRAAKGITVAVGRRASRAFYRLTDSIEVVWFLEWLEREWEMGRAR
jgi:trehalose-phosphatase